MNKYIALGFLLLIISLSVAQNTDLNIPTTGEVRDGDNGFRFETVTTGVNTKYSDYGIGFFREKFITFSARKIGAFAKIDPATDEPYTKLYCSDVTYLWDLKRPQLFSHVLNQSENLGTIAFSKDGNKIFYTQSQEGDTNQFDLYTGRMNPNIEGQWIDLKPFPYNDPSYSIENPYLSKDNKTLYFTSDMPEAIGGFDIFQVTVNDDGSFTKPERIEGSVNTARDEKFPQLSPDQELLYFSSNAHDTNGGYDVFRSRKTPYGYVTILNLGKTINSKQDEISYIPVNDSIGYLTSNRTGTEGSYDIFKVTETRFNQFVKGRTLDEETRLPLGGTDVVLLDTYGTEIARTKTGADGTYNFPVDSFLEYTLIAYKDGFERNFTSFDTNSQLVETFETEILMRAEAAEIVVTEEKSYIKIDKIFFDLNKASIREESTITLNTVVRTLKENPEIKVAINAHTDKQGQASYNLSLSDRRAASALRYIVSKGVDSSRVISKGYGETELLVDCDQCTKEQHQLNRRVEFVILTDDTTTAQN